MHQKKLHVYRSYAHRNIVNIHLSYNGLKQKGLLGYVPKSVSENEDKGSGSEGDKNKDKATCSKDKAAIPDEPKAKKARRAKEAGKAGKEGKKGKDDRKKAPGLIPASRNECPSVCILCQLVVPEESHYITEHPDKLAQVQQLIYIGRTIANRLYCAGSREIFRNTEKPKKLAELLTAMYGANISRNVINPGKTVQKYNKSTEKCNNYLMDTLDNRSLLRKFTPSLSTLALGRSDLEKNLNLYCLKCAVWVRGRWVHHSTRHHKTLSKIEDEAVKLYSIRLKMVILHQILLCPENIKDYRFYPYLEASHFFLDSETPTMEQTAFFKTIRAVIHAVKVRIIARNHDSIYYNMKVSRIHECIYTDALAAAVRMIKKLFGGQFGGFTDMRKYHKNFKFSNRKKKAFARSNPKTKNAINFVSIRTEWSTTEKVNHTVLAAFDAATRLITVYDGSPIELRRGPLNVDLKQVLLACHQHAGSPLKAGYSLGYDIQWDEWSCGYRGIFACFATLTGREPSFHSPKLRAIFDLTKTLVERKGRGLETKSAEEIWRTISKPNGRRRVVPVQYQSLV